MKRVLIYIFSNLDFFLFKFSDKININFKKKNNVENIFTKGEIKWKWI